MPESEAAITFFPELRSHLPFSRAVRVGDIIYLSGQIGVRKDGSLPSDFAGQVRQTMDNINAVLESLGGSIGDVFKCLVMLEDMNRWPEFNEIYREYFPADRLPVRSAFGATGLAEGAVCEIEAWAYRPQG